MKNYFLKKSTHNQSKIGFNLENKIPFSILYLIFFGIFLFLGLVVKGQQLPSDSLKGLHSYEKLNYSQALSYLLRYKKEKQSKKNIYVIADCYQHIQNYKEAESWYSRAMEFKDIPSTIRFKYAQSLQENGKYLKAIKQYLLTKPINETETKLVERRIYSCEVADSIVKLPSYYSLDYPKEINSKYSEFGIIPYGKYKLFVSDRTKNDSLTAGLNENKDIYGWTQRGYDKLYFLNEDSLRNNPKIKLFDSIEIGGDYHIGPLVFNKAQNLAFYTITHRVNPHSLTKDHSEIKNFINRLEIYYSKKVDGHWRMGTPVPFNNVLQYSVGHPALSPNDSLLYFVSDMPGSIGGTDIYYVELSGDLNFGKPINAGPIINTEGNEKFPVFQPNGDLYFASDGLPGLGGLDIFRTRGAKTEWLKPSNLGAPVNSSTDDFSFLIQSRDIIGGYFSSNRFGGLGSDDFYYFKQIKPLKPLERVDSKQSPKDSLEEVKIQEIFFPQDSLAYIKQYTVLLPSEKARLDSIVREKTLATLKFIKAKQEHLKNIGHAFDQFRLDSAALREVDSAALILLNHPNASLTIIGHADSRGSDAYNLKLSKRRAEAVADRLKKLGINPKRLNVKWEGMRNPKVPCPVNSNCSEADYARNRRTELKVVGVSNEVIMDDSDNDINIQQELIKPKKIISNIPNVTSQDSLEKIKNNPIKLTDTSTGMKPSVNPNLDSLGLKGKIKKPTLVTKDDLKILSDSIANHNELYNALGEMKIDTVILTPRNLLIIRETDGTIQRLFLPASVLNGDQLIQDQLGNRWIIRRDRRVIKIKSDK